MIQDEQAKARLVDRYIKEAAAYGIEATGDNAESLEFFDYALSFLRRERETWVHNPGRMWLPEHCALHIDALTFCVEDTVRDKQRHFSPAIGRTRERGARV